MDCQSGATPNMSLLKNLSFYDDGDMPVQGVSGVSSECQAQLCPDSMSGARYMELVALGERKKVAKNFDVILADVTAGKYSSVKQFAEAHGKSTAWANGFRRVAVAQGLIADWRGCFNRTRNGEGAHG
jgi:hypothetical protein